MFSNYPPPPPLPPSPLPVPCLPSMQPTLKQEPGLGGEVMTDTVLRSRASTGVSVMLNMLGFVEQTTTTVPDSSLLLNELTGDHDPNVCCCGLIYIH